MASAQWMDRSVAGFCWNLIEASRLGICGSGKRRTHEAHPRAPMATTKWSRAAPQLMRSDRPSGSSSASRRVRSANRSIVPAAYRHCQG